MRSSTSISSVRCAAFASAAAVMGSAARVLAASPEEPSIEELQRQIASLKASVARLEKNVGAIDTAMTHSKAIDAAIADAESRPGLFRSDDLAAGWDKGFVLRSSDGAYVMQPFAQFQFRYVANDLGGDDGDDADEETFEAGFEVRRLKVGVEGNLFGEKLKYEFRLAANRNGGEVRPDNAYVQYAFTDEWAIRAGQFKLNWTAEESSGSSQQLAVERSLVNELLGGGNTGYVQGIALLYDPKGQPWRGELTFTDGNATANTNYTDGQNSADRDYQNFGVAARAEYKVFGKWSDQSDFSARGTKEALLVIGAGGDWAQGGNGDVYRMTIDAQYEHPIGVSLFASLLHNIETGSADSKIDDSWGGIVQAGYMLPQFKGWEVFGRYGWMKLSEESGGHELFHEITAGVNRYLIGRDAKISIDLNYLPNGSFGDASGLGVKNEEEDQLIFRTQLQILL